jgi:hypothetical protein
MNSSAASEAVMSQSPVWHGQTRALRPDFFRSPESLHLPERAVGSEFFRQLVQSAGFLLYTMLF